jgi:hypothetical protein
VLSTDAFSVVWIAWQLVTIENRLMGAIRSMKFNNYLSNIISDLSIALQDDLRKRRLKLAYREEKDGSFRIIFTQKSVGLGSSFSIKILPQEETNEFRATWAKARIHNLQHARVIKFSGQDYHADATGFSVSEDLGFQQSLAASADDVATHLQRLLRESGLANHADESDHFERRTSNPLIPILIDKLNADDLTPDSICLRDSKYHEETFSLVLYYGECNASIYFNGEDIQLHASSRNPLSTKQLRGRFALAELNNLVAAIRKDINEVQNEIDNESPGFSI